MTKQTTAQARAQAATATRSDTPADPDSADGALSERRIHERQLQIAQIESLEKFAADVAHDLNNIFMIIGGSLELFEDQDHTSERSRQLLARARRGLARGVHLTEGLLEFSRSDLKADTVVVNGLLSSCRQVLSQSVQDSVRVEIQKDAESGSCRVDEDRLRAALVKLALNADSAMPEGGTLSVSSARVRIDQAQADDEGVAPGDYIAISVRDTGMGMAPETLKHACEPFFTTKRNIRGHGLGLSQVRTFMHRSGGFLALESEIGQGTTATMHLPAVQP